MLKNVGISEKEGMEEKRLYPIDGVTLMDTTFSLKGFCVQGLIPQGLSILGGAPKVGKSWLVLDLCLRVAKGEPLWNLGTTQGTVLYLCLEDTLQRVQQRLSYITEDVPANVYFVTAAGTLADDLEAQLLTFIREHPTTVLIVIDTFQKIPKQLMNRWRYALQEQGVAFRSHRSNGERLVEVIYTPAVTQVTQKNGP